MPRIRQNEEKYIKEDFLREIRVRQAYMNLKQNELAAESGIPVSTFCKRLKAPGDFSIDEFRRLIQTADPDIEVVLRFIGYESKKIKKFKEEAVCTKMQG